MLNLIIKNLWARRRRNGWLFAELVLVSIVSWVIFDPAIVMSYVLHLPMGYDKDQLCMVSLAQHPKRSPQYIAEADSTLEDDYFRLVDQTGKIPNVEAAAPLVGFAYPGSSGSISSGYVSEIDTTKMATVNIMEFLNGYNYLKVFGIQAAKGYDIDEIVRQPLSEDDIIITESTANMLFGSNRSQMRVFKMTREGIDTTSYIHVKGVVKDIRMYSYYRSIPIVFLSRASIVDNSTNAFDASNVKILLRVKESINLQRFIQQFREENLPKLHSGNLYVQTIVSYPNRIKKMESHITKASIIRWCLTIFFLINLSLGVTGTFWLQTRIRKEDVGIMLSYGATPNKIVSMLMGEGVILTTVAVIAGCLIYLQYALSEGLYKESSWSWIKLAPSWIDSFPLHFLLVSCIVWIVMLGVVMIGIYIPAKRISRIQPTEALRDE